MLEYTTMKVYVNNMKYGFLSTDIIFMIKATINTYFTEEFYEQNINLDNLFLKYRQDIETYNLISNIICLSGVLGYKEYEIAHNLSKRIYQIMTDNMLYHLIKFDMVKAAMHIYCSTYSIRDFNFTSILDRIIKIIEINELEISLAEFLAIRINMNLFKVKKLTIVNEKYYKINKLDLRNYKCLEELKITHTGYEIILPDTDIKKIYIMYETSSKIHPIFTLTEFHSPTHLTVQNCAVIAPLSAFNNLIEFDISNSYLSLPNKILKLNVKNSRIKKLICNNQLTGYENLTTLEYLEINHIYPDSCTVSIDNIGLKELHLNDVNVVSINAQSLQKLVLNKIFISNLILPNLKELYMVESKYLSIYAPMVTTLSISHDMNLDPFYKLSTLELSKTSDESWFIFNSMLCQQIENLYINKHNETLNLSLFTNLKELYINYTDKLVIKDNIKINIIPSYNEVLLKGFKKNMSIELLR